MFIKWCTVWVDMFLSPFTVEVWITQLNWLSVDRAHKRGFISTMHNECVEVMTTKGGDNQTHRPIICMPTQKKVLLSSMGPTPREVLIGWHRPFVVAPEFHKAHLCWLGNRLDQHGGLCWLLETRSSFCAGWSGWVCARPGRQMQEVEEGDGKVLRRHGWAFLGGGGQFRMQNRPR